MVSARVLLDVNESLVPANASGGGPLTLPIAVFSARDVDAGAGLELARLQRA